MLISVHTCKKKGGRRGGRYCKGTGRRKGRTTECMGHENEKGLLGERMRTSEKDHGGWECVKGEEKGKNRVEWHICVAIA